MSDHQQWTQEAEGYWPQMPMAANGYSRLIVENARDETMNASRRDMLQWAGAGLAVAALSVAGVARAQV